MRGLVFTVLLLHIASFGFGKKPLKADYKLLNQELSKRDIYDNQKKQVIQKLKLLLKNTPQHPEKQFAICGLLYNQYKSYQYDSAYVYSSKLQQLSLLLKDKNKEAYSRVKTGFILLSAGMFKETFEVLNTVKVQYLNDSTKFEYYALQSRANYDLAAFDHDTRYSPYYNRLANKYLDSAIAISQPGSYEYNYYSNYQHFKNGNYAAAEAGFVNLLKSTSLTQHQTAIIASTLSNVYAATNNKQQHDAMLIKAVINDIQTSTKETLALFWLAEKCYQDGDVKNAYQYIQQALKDAEFYGARQRQVQISTVLPIIATQNLRILEEEKTRFLIYLISTTALSLLIILVSIKLFKQLKDLKIKEKIIADKNDELKMINHRLEDDTHIKEEYIGYFFDLISGYILKLEKLKRSVDMKLSVKKYDDIPAIIHAIQIKKEREILFHTFDQVFLKIFPQFITSFNALFKAEDQIWPKEHEVLTTDLRIFALIRLGITDNETIAKILEYSEKTIYVYKMRMKAKSLVHGEEFEQRILAIRAGDLA
ncbi:MAG: tetratricopeptide repeat protein [Sphingobacteriaceae bacterium]|nr:MAG: tetratricopeptide repeat protein [Sphingobacteriaceae bacterium]